MLTAAVVIIAILCIGFSIGCALAPTGKPRDISQPDQCDPKGPCNTGKDPDPTSELLRIEIENSKLTQKVKDKLLADMGRLP